MKVVEAGWKGHPLWRHQKHDLISSQCKLRMGRMELSTIDSVGGFLHFGILLSRLLLLLCWLLSKSFLSRKGLLLPNALNDIESFTVIGIVRAGALLLRLLVFLVAMLVLTSSNAATKSS